jgi:hypothetical protein
VSLTFLLYLSFLSGLLWFGRLTDALASLSFVVFAVVKAQPKAAADSGFGGWGVVVKGKKGKKN